MQYVESVALALYVRKILPFRWRTAGPSFTLKPLHSQSNSGTESSVWGSLSFTGVSSFARNRAEFSSRDCRFCAQTA